MTSQIPNPKSQIFVLGYPGQIGGANTECWHTVKLWRKFGLDVTLVPTWTPNPEYERALTKIGACTVHDVNGPEQLCQVPGFAGSIVVGFCNRHYLEALPTLKALGCRLVWVNCMTFLFRHERRAWKRNGGPDAVVFQSEFQAELLTRWFAEYGPVNAHLIRGAFFPDEFPFRPRKRGQRSEVRGHKERGQGSGVRGQQEETDNRQPTADSRQPTADSRQPTADSRQPFVVGRISRAAVSKFPDNLWEMFERIPDRRVRVLGWSPEVEARCGPPPAWAEVLPPGAESVPDFLRSLHCLVQVNGGDRENWPRVGLEAMAAGVPVIAENQWGWPEMIDHGRTGLLGPPGKIPKLAAQLAQDEARRLDMARNARKAVQELSDPATIWTGWKRLFEGLGTRG
jgi:glycosyltransferase involved in cell wall biosynthesis